VRFQWNPRKAAANLIKHDVSFDEGSTVFGDPLAATIDDPEHSADETRYVTIGHSARGRLIVVVHADRQEDIRIISARRATLGEKKKYAEAQRKGR
jgi:uncharacterized DUF497 family protein